MFCGDEVSIYLSPCQLGNDNFEINYIIMSSGERQINRQLLATFVLIHLVEVGKNYQMK
jgi:hypothetical protein